MTRRPEASALSCPCGNGQTLDACCLPFLDGTATPSTAEALMRSRYTAYALARADYLLATWHASTRPAGLDLETPPQPKWIGLEVVSHQQQDSSRATVEFVARCRVSGRAQRVHELSRFVREDGRWFYVDGETD